MVVQPGSVVVSWNVCQICCALTAQILQSHHLVRLDYCQLATILEPTNKLNKKRIINIKKAKNKLRKIKINFILLCFIFYYISHTLASKKHSEKHQSMRKNNELNALKIKINEKNINNHLYVLKNTFPDAFRCVQDLPSITRLKLLV